MEHFQKRFQFCSVARPASLSKERKMRMGTSFLKTFVIAMSFALMPCAFSEDGLTDMKVGSKDAAGVVTGAAGTGGAQNEAKQLVKYDKPFGKVAVYEPQDTIQKALTQFSLPSPTEVLSG